MSYRACRALTARPAVMPVLRAVAGRFARSIASRGPIVAVEAAVSSLDRILVAVADDAPSRAAVGAAAELAAGRGAEVLAVHVWCRDLPCCGPSAADCGLREDDDSLERALDRLREAGVRCRGERWRTVDGRVLQTLLAAASDYDASLVIVGSRRQGWLPALLRPGLGLRVARRCARPVLLVS